VLIVMAGLPGTGKSTIARRLACELPAVLLDKDSIRAAIFPPSEIEYSVQQDDLCMRVVLLVAQDILRRNLRKHIVVDGRPFSRRYQVMECAKVAHGLGVPLSLIHCVCSDETVRRRLESDTLGGSHVAANRDYALYQSLKAHFEPIALEHLIVNTDEDVEACVGLCLDYLRSVQQATTSGT